MGWYYLENHYTLLPQRLQHVAMVVLDFGTRHEWSRVLPLLGVLLWSPDPEFSVYYLFQGRNDYPERLALLPDSLHFTAFHVCPGGFILYYHYQPDSWRSGLGSEISDAKGKT